MGMPKQQTIHGFPIIESLQVPRTRNGAQGYIVTVDRGKGYIEGNFQRYVTSLWFEGEDGWCQGHYRTERLDAHKELEWLFKLYTS